MEPDFRYLASLRDILEYGQEALKTVGGLSFQDYLNDRAKRLVIERCLSIVGEACVRIRKSEQPTSISELEKIIQFRNIIVHAYDGVDQATVWLIVKKYLPVLLEEVNSELKKYPDLGESHLN